MAFIDFTPDLANITKGNEMDALDYAGGDLGHLLTRAAMLAVGDPEVNFTEQELEALRSFRSRSLVHYRWDEMSRERAS